MTREDAIKAWGEWRENGYSRSAMPNIIAFVMAYNALCGPENLRPRAHWVHKETKLPGGVLSVEECSLCEYQTWRKTNFCPCCGAKMED